MSDSFADLWNSTTPQKKQQNLGSLVQNTQSSQTQQRRTQPDLFTLLSSSSTASSTARSSPSLRSLTPSNHPTPPPSQQSQAKGSTDAFSDLLSTSSFTSTTSTQNLTIAQRAALADKQRQQALQTQKLQKEKENTAWAGLDTLGGLGLTPSAASNTKPGPALADDDDWGLGDFAGGTSVQPAKDIKDADGDWDLGDFGSSQPGPAKPAATTTAGSTKSSKTLWDLEDLTSSPTGNTKNGAPTLRVDSPSNDFDFGSHEDGLFNRDNHKGDAQDDFMSVFNRPPQPKPTPSPRPSHQEPSTPSPPATSTSDTRNSSPPPHILGQIVEMGFSIPLAKAALAANNNNVQAALDQLLSSTNGGSGSGRATPSSTFAPPPPPQPPHQQSNGSIPRRRDREIQRERERDQRRTDNNVSPAGSGAGSSDLQVQAEQLLAQASEIGRGMFTKASLFWKEKREQVQKVVEEQVVGARGSGSGSSAGPAGTTGPNMSGRPKWMQESAVVEDHSPVKGGGFKYDDEGDEPEVRIPRRLDRQRDRERERAREPATTSQPPEPEVDLFADSVQSVKPHANIYTPPYRHAKSSPAPTHTTTSAPPRRPQVSRELTPIPSTIAALKAEANATFKLGQFGNAETLYSRAIDAMGRTACHMYFVPLLNNRANTRMKIGDMSGAVRDCESVVTLISKNQLQLSDDLDALVGGRTADEGDLKIDWEPSLDGKGRDGKVLVPVEGGTSEEVIDLTDGLVKAIKRRAEACEGMEKWAKAKRDWEWLRSVLWVRDGMRSEAGRGVSRCARMLGRVEGTSSGPNNHGPSSQATPASAPKPRLKPKPAPQVTISTAHPSEAVQALRNTNAQAEAEDLVKHSLKDQVDTKLANWRKGKETNIRALLASLDLVLWEEVSSVKVGMHELVTPAQVKVKYMKAVAKVHPDKLNTNNSTLEQRMIAQGVFGMLNEAWNVFKQ